MYESTCVILHDFMGVFCVFLGIIFRPSCLWSQNLLIEPSLAPGYNLLWGLWLWVEEWVWSGGWKQGWTRRSGAFLLRTDTHSCGWLPEEALHSHWVSQPHYYPHILVLMRSIKILPEILLPTDSSSSRDAEFKKSWGTAWLLRVTAVFGSVYGPQWNNSKHSMIILGIEGRHRT